MANESRCSECGTPLTDVQSGDCPRCLMALALEETAESESATRDPRPVAPHERIGRYTILRSLGEGGMGQVFLAEQRTPIHRRVAIKVIKLGMDTRQVVARFEAERQALALMDHPGIARVIDAGATEEGRPYFVMEYVPGEAITMHCDRKQLSLRDRIGLFLEVCEAVQHAHQKGVIHRDLKPSNVLVADSPKIIDFGIAKAIAQKLTDRTLFTEIGTVVGTLEYMSPEQAELSALDVDTRTDVYSLGIMLYELLTGVLPFDPAELRAAAVDVARRRIVSEEPSRPSMRLETLGDLATESARRRQLPLPVLQRELEGDLDWITLKALEKEPARRYDSPAELARDLRRHLEHEPVEARPPSKIYKLRKFVRRNRLLVASAVTVLLALLAGVVGTTTFGLREAEQRREAERVRADLEQVAQFQARMLDGMDTEGMGERLVADLRSRVAELHRGRERSDEEVEAAVAGFESTMEGINATDAALRVIDEEILARALDTMEEQFADQPLIDARLRHTIGLTYGQLGFPLKGVPLLEEAASTRKRELGPDHPDTLETMNRLANSYRSRGSFAEAESIHLEILEVKRRSYGPEHPETLRSMNNLANLYERQGRHEDAQGLHEQTLEIRRRVLGSDHKQTLQSLNNLANAYWSDKRYEEAEPLYVEAVEGWTRALGPDHRETLRSMTNLASLYDLQGRYDEAERLHLEALEAKRRVLGTDHPDTLYAMNNLASLYGSLGRHDEAEPLFRETLEVKLRVFGREHLSTLSAMNNLAMVYEGQGRHAEAEPLFTETFESRKRLLGPDHRSTLSSMNLLAGFLLTREPATARDPARGLRLARELAERTGSRNPRYLDTLSVALHATGATEAAIANQSRAIALVPDESSALRAELEQRLADIESAVLPQTPHR